MFVATTIRVSDNSVSVYSVYYSYYFTTLCAPKIQNSVHFQNLVSPEPSIFCYSGCFHRILHKILHNIGHGRPMIQQSFLQCLYSVKVHEIFFKQQNYVSIKSFTTASEIYPA